MASGRLLAILEFLYVASTYLRPLRAPQSTEYQVMAVLVGVYCICTAIVLAIPKIQPRRLGAARECALVCGLMVLPLAIGVPRWMGFDAGVTTLSAAGYWLMGAGAVGALVGTVTMGRSFGLLPARRRIVQSGLHAVVRHPIYTCHGIILIGYLLIVFSPWTAGIVAASLVGLAITAAFEERVLRGDGEYEAYCRRVRWAFVPYIA